MRQVDFPKEVVAEAYETIVNNPHFMDAYDIARANSDGDLYLVGGKLYRTLIEVMYGYAARSEHVDYDFVTNEVKVKKKIPRWWSFRSPEYNRAVGRGGPGPTGSIRLQKKTKKGCKVDLIYTGDITQIKEGRIQSGIDGYLKCVPLDIQAIAINLNDKTPTLHGDAGKMAILNKTVSVNNYESYVNYSSFKGYKLLRYLNDKATSVKFETSPLDEYSVKVASEELGIRRLLGLGLTLKQIESLPSGNMRILSLGKNPPHTIKMYKKGSTKVYSWVGDALKWVTSKPREKKLFDKKTVQLFESASGTEVFYNIVNLTPL